MKRAISGLVFFLFIFQFISAQQKERFGEVKRLNDTVFVSVNEKLFVANKEVVTVKLKSGVNVKK